LHGDRAGPADVRLAPSGERDVEIGGGEGELAVAGVEEEVGEDRDRRPPFDDALEKRELRQQRVALETDVHTSPLLFDSGSLNGAEYSTGTVQRRAVEDAENHALRSAKSSLTGRGELWVF